MTKALKWTLETAAREFGVSRETVKRGLTANGETVKRGRASSFTTQQIVAAIFGDLKHERLLKTREERTLLELERREKEGELVSMAAAVEILTRAYLPVRQRLLALPSEMASRCNPTDPTFAHKALDEWVERAMRQIQSGLPKAAKTTTTQKKR